MAVPRSTVAVDPSTAPAAEAAARAFLERYWAPVARTSAQLADAIAPYATDNVLAVFRDPARADQALPAAGIGDITVRTTSSTATTAEVLGQGVKVDVPERPLEFRTLSLVRRGDGAWRVDAIR